MDYVIKNTILKSDYKRLRKAVDFPYIRDILISKLLNNSSYLISVLEDEKCIACARVISDCASIYLLCDLMVDPIYQGKGIGRLMVNSLLERIKADNKNNNILIYVMSLNGKEEFYKKLGFCYNDRIGLSIKYDGCEVK